MAEFVMPTLGADMTAGRLVVWLKQPGDAVKRGEIIAEVDTDKGVIEIEVFRNGVIEKLLVEPGVKVPVGTPLAIIREEVAAPIRQPASPAARRLAGELGVDIGTIQGTGPEGAVTRADVERAVAAPAAPAAAPAPDRQSRMRQAVAAAVTRSKREIPHYYVSTIIDLGDATAWLAQRNRELPVGRRLVHGALLVKAVALTLRDYSDLNSKWVEGQVVPSAGIHVGLAVSLRGGGLVVAAIHDTDRRSVEEVMAGILDLVQRARSGSLRSSELSDPTITVTMLGERGVDTVYGVIYPPQVAIVGFGRVVERPWSVGGAIVSRPVVTASLAADHRVTDGHRGARFLADVGQRLQDPGSL